MVFMRRLIGLLFLCIPLIGLCQKNIDTKLFKISSSKESNIFYNGNFRNGNVSSGGVGIGDINNDGLEDIYFTGSQRNALYLNKGNLVFEDITEKAGVEGIGLSTGVCIGDMNNDGYKDIIIGRDKVGQGNMGIFNSPEQDLDLIVYINNGNLTFSNKTKELGIETNQVILQNVLLDINKDKKLDIYSTG